MVVFLAVGRPVEGAGLQDLVVKDGEFIMETAPAVFGHFLNLDPVSLQKRVFVMFVVGLRGITDDADGDAASVSLRQSFRDGSGGEGVHGDINGRLSLIDAPDNLVLDAAFRREIDFRPEGHARAEQEKKPSASHDSSY